MSQPQKKFFSLALGWWKRLGPGLITGASDDDPSGITTYSITGAQTGYQTLWTALYSIPLMVAIQEMCARIGLVTGEGLAGTIRRHYNRPLLMIVAILTIAANTLNIGADLNGMASATALVLPIPTWLLALVFAVGIAITMLVFPYYKIARVLKWLTFVLFTYVATAFITHQNWTQIIFSTLVPHFSWSKEYVTTLVAILGTTISPYLFFWMASEEVEERESKAMAHGKKFIVTKHELKDMREDVSWGMIFSNIIMFFIIATTASVFVGHGLSDQSSIADVATALRPLAGDAAFLLFALGVVGTGFLAIPVLAGSSAYVLSEAFGLEHGLSKKFREAKTFYITIFFSAVVGFLMTLSSYSAVYLLFFTAVVYGLISPPLIAVILHIANNPRVMGKNVNDWKDNMFGGIAFVVMAAAAIAMLWFLLHP